MLDTRDMPRYADKPRTSLVVIRFQHPGCFRAAGVLAIYSNVSLPLLRRHRHRSEVAVMISASLLDRCRPLLRLQVRRLQLDERLQRRFDSSDLIQDALTRAISHADQFRGETECEAIRWLQQILRHVVLNKVTEAHAQVRDIGREQSLEQLLDDSSARIGSLLAAPTPSPSDKAQQGEDLLQLAAAVEQLPEDQRDAVSLRDLHGYTVAEIAEILLKTEKAVAGLIFRGRIALRNALG
jgi:RNA polymerase sigma-70 factor, ECF subfamily